MKSNHNNHNTTGLSSSYGSFKTRSSASQSHLPSVSLSANSFATPRAGNTHNNLNNNNNNSKNNQNNRALSPLKSSWKQEYKLETLSRQNTDASAVTLSSVHWSTDDDGGKRADAEGGKRRSSRKTPDQAKLWARYVRTTAADRLNGSSSRAGRVHFGGLGGEGGGKDDGRYSKKLSLPCPSAAACCFCVYSRQLGPVRVYMSSLRPADSRRRKPDSAAKAEEAQPPSSKHDKPKVVFLKERWLRSSAPSGEVIVPELPEPEEHKPSYHDRCLSSSNPYSVGDVYSGKELHWNHRVLAHGMSLPTRHRTTALMRKPDYSSVVGLGSYASNFNHLDPEKKKRRSARSVSFQDDVDLERIPSRLLADSCVGQTGGSNKPNGFSCGSRGALSRSAPAVYIGAGSPGRKGRLATKIALYDYVKCPEPFSKPREFPLPVRLVPARQGK